MKTEINQKKISGFHIIRNRILVGVLLATPIMATVWIFKFLLNLSTAWIPVESLTNMGIPFSRHVLQGIVLLCVIFVFYILGFLIQNFFGKKIYQLTDKILSKIPLIKNIYIFIRQLCEWVAKSHSTMFESVVLVEYPRKGIYAIGLATSQTQQVITSKIRDENGQPVECMNVFISTTPNPTSGVYIIVPENELIKLDMDVTTAINQIVSAGAIIPGTGSSENDSPLM
ncbi:MAG: DUF502 domain-containing protein, partial [Kiritimatiellae bacterium]|nr:DUF502 domain-containing protein [Kiritimatiellia bacterium]